MTGWQDAVAKLRRNKTPAVLVSVDSIVGSTPREEGAKMIVTATQLHGTIGGGNLEYQACQIARNQLELGADDGVQRFPLGAGLGQCCGGLVNLMFEKLTDDSDWDSIAGEADHIGLYLFGAGHVGQAVVRALRDLPVTINWIDTRDDMLPQQPPPGVTTICTDTPEAEIDVAPAGCYFLVMTHDHGLDQRLCEQILKRDDFTYFGLIGSRSKRRNFETRMRRRGVDVEKFGRMTCPIGVGGIGSKQPAQIAISVAAEILQVYDRAHNDKQTNNKETYKVGGESMTSDTDGDQTPRLELHGITKIYPSVIANEDVSLSVKRGEIHAVLGENGAGKSTLMKMIYGVAKPDAGEMKWEGEVVQVENPAHARSLGIGMVFQHFSLFETLNVVENVALALPGNPDLKQLAEQITEVSNRYGLPVDPGRLVHALSVGERQRVEIIRCLLQNPKLLIMDEPTSVLTPQAVRKLFDTLRQLADEGCSILYISHKLDEIQELCHVATVLRDGKVTGDCIPSEETPKSMASLMIGKELPVPEHSAPSELGEIRLQLNRLSKESDDPFGTHLQDIELEVRSGEILGIAGVSGNGQQELLYALSGEIPVNDSDSIVICGNPSGRDLPDQRRGNGMGFVPEERLGRGAVPRMSLTENALLTAHRAGMLKRGMIQFDKISAFASKCIEDFNVKCGGAEHTANSLSGGNLQKFIMGREILLTPKLLVVAQPTWGVDVGAAAFIRQELIDLRNQGTAILVISEELEELFEISDRIAVIADGRISPAKKLADTNIDEIGVWMSGMWDQAAPAEVAAHD